MPWHAPAAPDHRQDNDQVLARWAAGPTWDGSWVWQDSAADNVELGLRSFTTGLINEFTVAIDGAVRNDWSSVSWQLGRTDWFSTLASTTASVVIQGYTIPAVGVTVVISDIEGLYWVGYVESANATQSLDGTWVSTISCVDTVGRLGQAEVSLLDIASGTLETQVVYLLAQAGIDAEVELDDGVSLPTLDAVTDYTGSVLDYISRAERSSNAVIFMRPTGDLRISQRVPAGDYGDRVLSGTRVVVPTSHWRMDESSGNIADSAAAITGTAAGTPTYSQTGPWGANGPTAIGFQKTDGADKFTFGDNFDLTVSAWAMAGWAWWDGTTGGSHPIFQKTAAGPNGWLCRVQTDGSLLFAGFNAGATIASVSSGTNTVPVQTWFHWAITLLSGTVRLYIDGVEIASAATTGSIPNTAATLNLGSDGTSLWFGGYMSQVSIWTSGALLAEDIQWLISPGVDLSGAASPSDWSVDKGQDSVINSWQLTKEDGTVVAADDHADSIDAYGLRAFQMGDYLASVSTHFPAGLRTALEEPRMLLAGASFPVVGYESYQVLDLEPLDLVGRNGEAYQVLSVSHQVDQNEWRITITGDLSRDEISGGGTVPAPPPTPPVVTSKTTQTVEFPTDAGYIKRFSDGTTGRSFGAAGLPVGYDDGDRYRGLFKFALTTPLPDYISLVKAELWLEGRDGSVGTGSAAEIYARRITSNWSSGSVNWPGPSAVTTSQAVFEPDVPASGVSVGPLSRVDVTEIIRAEILTGTKYGIELVSTNENAQGHRAEFYQSGSLGPRLVLTWEVAA